MRNYHSLGIFFYIPEYDGEMKILIYYLFERKWMVGAIMETLLFYYLCCRRLCVSSFGDKNFMSCTVYLIMYVGCPVLWCSKLQTSHRSVLYFIEIGDAKNNTFYVIDKGIIFIFDTHVPKPGVFCKVAKYNQSCIAVSKSNNFCQ